MGRDIFKDTAALAGTQLSGIAVKKDLKPKKETDNIPDKKVYCGRDLSGCTKGKTAAIKFVVPYQVYGDGNNEGKQHGIDNQRSGSGVDTKDQGSSCKKLDIRQDYGNQIDGGIRKKIVSVNYFCKMCRFNDLVITGNEE